MAGHSNCSQLNLLLDFWMADLQSVHEVARPTRALVQIGAAERTLPRAPSASLVSEGSLMTWSGLGLVELKRVRVGGTSFVVPTIVSEHLVNSAP